jgi:hypothetical protein
MWLSYDAPKPVVNLFKFHQAQLLKAGWKELPGSYITEASASATFEKNGYGLSLMASPTKDKARVSFTPHGNLPLDKLPVPPGSTLVINSPAMAMFTSPADVATSTSMIEKELTVAGWKPYGSAGPMLTFSQNGMLLSVMISAAPAQGGKTSLMYSSVLRSADLPVSKGATAIQYSDQLTQVGWDSQTEASELIGEMRSILEAKGWEPTTTNPILIDYKLTTIFRSADKGMLILEVRDLKPGSRAMLREYFPEEVPGEGATPKSSQP